MQTYDEPIVNNNAVATFGTLESNNTRATPPPPRYRDSYFDRFSNKKFSKYFDEIYRHVRMNLSRKFRVKNQGLREFLAELFGTFIFLSFALASVAQYKLGKRGDTSFNEAGFLSVNISFGLGLAIAIMTVGNVSDWLAVSFSMLLQRQLSFWKFCLYITAQSIGAFFASLMVYLVYHDQLKRFPGGMHSIETAGIFATFPNDMKKPNIALYLLDQVFATVLFVVSILAVTDRKNNLQQPFIAMFIGISLLVIGTSYGYNSGFAINPARDFWPRVFTALAGWGHIAFTAGFHFFWIPIVGPMIGSLIATIIYGLFISNHHEYDEEFQEL